MKLNQDGPVRIDAEIDAALKLLSEAQPPAAMVSRIQQSLSAAASRRRAVPGRALWIPTAVGVAIVAVLFAAFVPAHFERENWPSSVETAKMAIPASASERIDSAQPLVVPAETLQRKRAKLSTAAKVTRRGRPQYRHVANLLSYPLTQQEKLLVRFAQTAKPADLQMLNPEYQAKIEAQQEAKFAAYLESRGIPESNETTN